MFRHVVAAWRAGPHGAGGDARATRKGLRQAAALHRIRRRYLWTWVCGGEKTWIGGKMSFRLKCFLYLLLGIYQQDRWSPPGAGREMSPPVSDWAQPRQAKLCPGKNRLIYRYLVRELFILFNDFSFNSCIISSYWNKKCFVPIIGFHL